MPAPILHPATGKPIALAPDEQLQRIVWPGAPVLVITAHRPTYRSPAGELAYRLARPDGSAWNPAEGLQLEPWEPSPATADSST